MRAATTGSVPAQAPGAAAASTKAKKKRKKTPASSGSGVMLPTAVTLERGAPWAFGARPLVPASSSDGGAAVVRRQVLPPREEHNSQTLAAPGAGAPVRPLVELLLANNNSWYAASPEETLRVTAASELLVDAQLLQEQLRTNAPSHAFVALAQQETLPSKSVRLVSGTLGNLNNNVAHMARTLQERGFVAPAPAAGSAPPPSATALMVARYAEDRAERELRFFDEDPLALDEPPGLPCDAYAMMQSLRARFGPVFERRFETEAALGERAPHPVIEKVSRRYLQPFRYAPRDHERACCNASSCICHTLAMQLARPEYAYVAREFLLPSQLSAWSARRAAGLPVNEANDGVAGPCLDCLLIRWMARVHENIQLKHQVLEPFNTFQVRVEEGEYAREYVLENVVNGLATGIEGFVPMFLTNKRQYEVGPLVTLNGVPRYPSYLAEVGMDFRRSLSEANTCLGAFKARPLCSEARRVQAPAHVFLPRRDLEAAAGHAPAWVRFVRDCHAGVLLDRHLLGEVARAGGVGTPPPPPPPVTLEATRVPAAWLRLALVLPHLDHPRGLVRDMPPSLQRALGALLCGGGAGAGLDAARVLVTLADLVFCSYERSVAHWLAAARAPAGSPLVRLALAPIALLLTPHLYPALAETVGEESAGFLLPPRVARWRQALGDLGALGDALFDAGADGGSSHVLWAVAMWRWAVALVLERSVAWPAGARRDTLLYQARLFRDTHLDLLTHMAAHRRFGDAALFAPAPVLADEPPTRRPPLPWLALFYPSCQRVLCAEELPDLAPALNFGNPWFDTGNNKARENVFQTLVHSFVFKVLNQPCQRRQDAAIRARVAHAFPVIGALVRLVFRCVLLGNVPGAPVGAGLPLAARVRVTASFAPHAAPGVDARFEAFMREKRMLTRSLITAFFVSYTVRNHHVLWTRHFATSRRFLVYTELVEQACAIVRRELARAVAADTRAVSWEAVEATAQRAGGTISGPLMEMHDRALHFFSKLKKGRFEEVLLKKMTAVEGALAFDHAALRAWFAAGDRLHWCHFVTWVLARRSNSPRASLRQRQLLETRWLRALGMSEAGLALVRRWQFEYYEYDVRDDNLKLKASELHAASATDYVLLKTYCRLFTHYRSTGVFLLSVDATRAQIEALRGALGVEPWFASPPRLGRGYYCTGCLKWASRTLEPLPVLAGDRSETHLALADAANASPSFVDFAFGSNADDGSVVSLRAAFLNPLDGQLYCRRGRFGAAGSGSGGGGGAPDADDADADEARDAAFEALAEGDVDVRQWARDHEAQLAPAEDLPPPPAPPVRDDRDDEEEEEEEEEDDDDDDEALEDRPVPKGKASKTKAAPASDVSRQYVQAFFSCQQPLAEVDMLGVYKCLHGVLYGMCVYCGCLCEVDNVNVTNRGLSCGRHALVAEYPAYHRLWLSLGVPRAQLSAVARTRPEHARPRTPCLACRAPAAPAARLDAYDLQHRRFTVPLCAYHRDLCRALVPLPRAESGHAAPPVRIDHLLDALRERPT